MTREKRPFLERDTDCWALGSGLTVETCLIPLYDAVLNEPIPQDMKALLDKLP